MLKRMILLSLLIFSLCFSMMSCGNKQEDDKGDLSITDSGDESQSGSEDGESDDGESQDDENDDKPASDGEGDPGKDSADEIKYIRSINSKKYHLSTCYYSVAMSAGTKVELSGTIEDLRTSGYIPCKVCKPDPDYDYETSGDSGSSEDEEALEFQYILNYSTKKIHLFGCPSVKTMSEENKQYSNETLEELLRQGYSLCGNCNP